MIIFASVTQQFNLPPNMLSAVCFTESSFNISAIHYNDGSTDSYGICQIKLETAQWLGFQGSIEELMRPRTNIYYAGKYLSYNLHRYHGNMHRALTAYNRGNARGLLYSEYSTRVLANMEK